MMAGRQEAFAGQGWAAAGQGCLGPLSSLGPGTSSPKGQMQLREECWGQFSCERSLDCFSVEDFMLLRNEKSLFVPLMSSK